MLVLWRPKDKSSSSGSQLWQITANAMRTMRWATTTGTGTSPCRYHTSRLRDHRETVTGDKLPESERCCPRILSKKKGPPPSAVFLLLMRASIRVSLRAPIPPSQGLPPNRQQGYPQRRRNDHPTRPPLPHTGGGQHRPHKVGRAQDRVSLCFASSRFALSNGPGRAKEGRREESILLQGSGVGV